MTTHHGVKIPDRIDVKGCARCGRDHRRLKLYEFHIRPEPDCVGWADCPTNDQPILYYIRKTDGRVTGKTVPPPIDIGNPDR